jgi:hypothetical protein
MAAKRSASNPARSNAAKHTSEYHLKVTRGWKGANYAYPRGAGADAGKRPSYPLRPKARARSARARVQSRSNAGSLSHVDNAIRHIYGSVRAIYSGGGGRSARSSSRSTTRSTSRVSRGTHAGRGHSGGRGASHSGRVGRAASF